MIVRSLFGPSALHKSTEKVFKRLLNFKTLPTPNPNALKFISTECTILPIDGKTLEFTSSMQAVHSPLVLKLFKLNGVRSVMLGSDFLTVNKQDHINWANLRPEVVDLMDQFLTSKIEPVATKELLDSVKNDLEPNEDDSETVAMIKELIDTRIRPAIQDDGGDIEYKAFDEETGKVFLKLRGACKSCSASEDTLKNGIESMLKYYIDDVKEVEQILDPEEEVALKEFDRLEENLRKKKNNKTEDFPPAL